MSLIEAFILGIVQGLTEFLPVSSSGHIELAKAILGTEVEEDVLFTVILHGATVLSTLVIYFQEIKKLIIEGVQPKWNDSKQYILFLVVSMIPVFFVGMFFKDTLENIFFGNILAVGIALLFTGALLSFTYLSRDFGTKITWSSAIVMGIAQAIAVIPGISRSGSTIATGLLMGVKKEEATRFSFLMVLAPIMGANLLELLKFDPSQSTSLSWPVIIVGFITAFVSGVIACKWMIKLVKKGKLIYFAIYCLLVGTAAIVLSLI
ncbi:undecaprenyl-diphosphate phosphatase [Persicobacter sp. CCB-QB2]|uniref:undecaprenyl-diphosphate phosphatase n=1 Tax=Persicobacter sp. CCB-QB2 TaxID=1561025 RepID=UPI0006A95A58|nr:undecaprenyl-diphosphate phosphatase [Persicobacter sp. CCB-QB2]